METIFIKLDQNPEQWSEDNKAFKVSSKQKINFIIGKVMK
jgi:hypothetical protein